MCLIGNLVIFTTVGMLGGHFGAMIYSRESFINENLTTQLCPHKNVKKRQILEKIQKRYDEKTDIIHAASQLWVDAIIQPEKTRSWISMGIEIANNAPSQEKFNMGVLQV